jgi:outer membrane protein assembly factor BamB
MSVTVGFAPNVGSYVAASTVEGGALLAVTLAQGARGAHRINVYDTPTWRLVSSFPAPGKARSGVTRLFSDGATLIAGDDHIVTAFSARTGARLWERGFPNPDRLSILDVAGGRVLVQVELPDYRAHMLVLRASDGADERQLAESVSSGLTVAALAKDGTVIVAYQESIEVLRTGAPDVSVPTRMKTRGALDAIAVDETGTRVLLGNRSGEVFLVDLASKKGKTILEMPALVRSVGFHRGTPWALDGDGRFRLLGKGKSAVPADLDVKTYGGFLREDGSCLLLGDYEKQTFVARSIPGGDEVFATVRGFACEAVGVQEDGALLVSGADQLVRIDPATGEVKELGADVDEITRLGDGTTLVMGKSARLLPRAKAKTKSLAKGFDDAAVCGEYLATRTNTIGELWHLPTAKRTWRLDVRKTWIGETNDGLRLVHADPSGRPIIHLSNGQVWWGDALATEDGYITKLSTEGALWVHPRGARLYLVDGRKITPIGVDGFRKGKPLQPAVVAEVGKLVFSPSGEGLVVFHRNGRFSTVDLAKGKSVAIATAATSAAELRSNELYPVDFRTPRGCAFSRDESTVAVTETGGITFARFHTGEILGRLFIATNGSDYLVTDGTHFDWTGASNKKPISSELVALEGGRALDLAALLARRAPGLLARFTA